ncbi:MAG TPA: hypothetical protein VFF52_09185 [Isosphaeraceae bacterium]|nr:hypothetical protein [Isosphaeraceae bacterium]
MRVTLLGWLATALGPALIASGVLLIATPGWGRGDEPQLRTTTKQLPTDGGLIPVVLPDPGIPGFTFPEAEHRILRWVRNNDQHSLSKHAWGLWTALNMPTDQCYEGQRLSVLETWVTPKDLQTLGNHAFSKSGRDPWPLTVLHQFSSLSGGGAVTGQTPDVLGFVKYDPTAAKHVLRYQLLSLANLTNLLQAGLTEIPPFPASALVLKIETFPWSTTRLVGGRYYALPAWPGPPDPPRDFPPDQSHWKQCIWVDIQENGPGTGTGRVDTVWNADGSSRTPETTYGLGRFIHFRRSATQAQLPNTVLRSPAPQGGTRAAAGDVVIVIGLHVTTKEIANWTWQTFWWTPDPDNPPPPSSTAIAACRPMQLQGAARHYAVAIGYSMVFPPGENSGGVYPSPQAQLRDSPSRVEPRRSNLGRSHVAESVYCYNPYIETFFTSAQLPASRPGTYLGRPVDNNVGVQTNCMSCHAQACFPIMLLPGGIFPLYTGDQNIDLYGPQFQGKLKVDFLWSINDDAS